MKILDRNFEGYELEDVKEEIMGGEYTDVNDLLSLNEGIIEFTADEISTLEDVFVDFWTLKELEAEQETWEQLRAEKEQRELEQELNWWINHGSVA